MPWNVMLGARLMGAGLTNEDRIRGGAVVELGGVAGWREAVSVFLHAIKTCFHGELIEAVGNVLAMAREKEECFDLPLEAFQLRSQDVGYFSVGENIWTLRAVDAVP